MLSLAFATISFANLLIADYKHVVSLAEAEIEQYETFEVTAYTAGPESTGKHPGHPLYGITASGAVVKENLTAACPPNMEFGTRVYIPELDTEFECQDRGGAITEGKLDVYMVEVEDALRFGRQQLDVIVR